MVFKKNDFVEIEYIGKVKDNGIFDTNMKSEAARMNTNIETRPLIICLGQGMILPSIDQFIIGKEPGKFELELSPEKAFGIRYKELVKTFPMSVFQAQQQKPFPGMVFYFDNLLGKVNSVSGGRVTIDFNNPLAGKFVQYTLDVKREIADIKEKARALLIYFMQKELSFDLAQGKIIIKCSKQEAQLLNILKPKMKEILALDIETESEPSAMPSAEKESSQNNQNN